MDSTFFCESAAGRVIGAKSSIPNSNPGFLTIIGQFVAFISRDWQTERSVNLKAPGRFFGIKNLRFGPRIDFIHTF
jgi:hypothetical protein